MFLAVGGPGGSHVGGGGGFYLNFYYNVLKSTLWHNSNGNKVLIFGGALTMPEKMVMMRIRRMFAPVCVHVVGAPLVRLGLVARDQAAVVRSLVNPLQAKE